MRQNVTGETTLKPKTIPPAVFQSQAGRKNRKHVHVYAQLHPLPVTSGLIIFNEINEFIKDLTTL